MTHLLEGEFAGEGARGSVRLGAALDGNLVHR